MLNSHRDLVEGQVYMFGSERVVYGLGSYVGQYEPHPFMADTHVFTAWPVTPNSRSVYFGSAEVDALIAAQELIAI